MIIFHVSLNVGYNSVLQIHAQRNTWTGKTCSFSVITTILFFCHRNQFHYTYTLYLNKVFEHRKFLKYAVSLEFTSLLYNPEIKHKYPACNLSIQTRLAFYTDCDCTSLFCACAGDAGTIGQANNILALVTVVQNLNLSNYYVHTYILVGECMCMQANLEYFSSNKSRRRKERTYRETKNRSC